MPESLGYTPLKRMPPVRVELTPNGLRVHRSALLSYGGRNGGIDETRTRCLTVDDRALCPLSYDPFESNLSEFWVGRRDLNPHHLRSQPELINRWVLVGVAGGSRTPRPLGSQPSILPLNYSHHQFNNS